MSVWEKAGRKLLGAAALAAALWLGARFLLPLLAPFLIAFALAAATRAIVIIAMSPLFLWFVSS